MRRSLVLLAWLIGFAEARAQGGRPRVECQLDREEIYEGESVDYLVEVLDVESPPQPDLSAFADFTVEARGSESVNSQSFEIRGGRTSRVAKFGMQHHFRLTPHRAGALTVPAPWIELDGKKLTGKALELRVLPPSAQQIVRLFVEVAPAEVYPQRPVQVRLRVVIKAVREGRTLRDPVELLGLLSPPEPPQLHVPWVELPSGLEATGWKEWLQAKAQRGGRGGGFAINEIEGGGLPLMLFDQRPRFFLFDLGGRTATDADLGAGGAAQHDLTGRASDYFCYELERTVTPTRSGTFRFGPVSLKGRVVESMEGRRVSLKEIYAVGSAADLVVKEPPVTGRPASFTGAVGSFALAADLSPRSAHVGDPLTLTLAVTGRGNLDELTAPDLTLLPEFTGSFKVYPATAETKGGARLFTWSLRPLAAGVTEVPPVPFAWFDPTTEQFVEHHSEALPLEVTAAAALDPDAIVRGSVPERGARELTGRVGGLFTHDTDPRHLGDERVEWRAQLASAIALPLLTSVALALLGAWKRRRGDPRAERRRRAIPRARERLASARQAAAGGDRLATARELRGALIGAIADARDLPEAGLTAREAAAAIASSTLLAARLREALERWESVQYTAPTASADELLRDGSALLDELATLLATTRSWT